MQSLPKSLLRADRVAYVIVENLPGSGNALMPPFEATIEGVCRDPILAVQHTRFACGGVALGIRLHHMVCAVGGFFQFVRDWATIHRSSSLPSQRILPVRTGSPPLSQCQRTCAKPSTELVSVCLKRRACRRYQPLLSYGKAFEVQSTLVILRGLVWVLDTLAMRRSPSSPVSIIPYLQMASSGRWPK